MKKNRPLFEKRVCSCSLSLSQPHSKKKKSAKKKNSTPSKIQILFYFHLSKQFLSPRPLQQWHFNEQKPRQVQGLEVTVSEQEAWPADSEASSSLSARWVDCWGARHPAVTGNLSTTPTFSWLYAGSASLPCVTAEFLGRFCSALPSPSQMDIPFPYSLGFRKSEARHRHDHLLRGK